MAQLLAGDFSPSGRLPLIFHTSVDQLPPFESYAMAGRTYRYFGGKPLYPFGHGLSCTRFAYDRVTPDRGTVAAGGSATAMSVVDAAGQRVVEPGRGIDRRRRGSAGAGDQRTRGGAGGARTQDDPAILAENRAGYAVTASASASASAPSRPEQSPRPGAQTRSS